MIKLMAISIKVISNVAEINSDAQSCIWIVWDGVNSRMGVPSYLSNPKL